MVELTGAYEGPGTKLVCILYFLMDNFGEGLILFFSTSSSRWWALLLFSRIIICIYCLQYLVLLGCCGAGWMVPISCIDGVSCEDSGQSYGALSLSLLQGEVVAVEVGQNGENNFRNQTINQYLDTHVALMPTKNGIWRTEIVNSANHNHQVRAQACAACIRSHTRTAYLTTLTRKASTDITIPTYVKQVFMYPNGYKQCSATHMKRKWSIIIHL